ncbi:nadh dehydrogenase [Fusarium circinatum]|uniref:Nadh dehydrogenase n=1 Tax=Fusarium circinatum TaxID=48490 RepID=A0A8H5TP90_FUSCI|nr:nadh dehydrogenase [Fusarium circinatum]
MRYEDWDVLLFEEGSGIPSREFKVACHVVQHAGKSMFGVLKAKLIITEAMGSALPTLTCFVPALHAGVPFRLSIHSWKALKDLNGDHILNISNSILETRLFIDGTLVATTSATGSIRFPLIVNRQGHESLKFPIFQQELLYQRHWSPADNLGRIKLLINQRFSSASPSVLFTGNVNKTVVFSFQHAPQHILEGLQIAWPNPAMWNRQRQPSAPASTDSSHASSRPPLFARRGQAGPEHISGAALGAMPVSGNPTFGCPNTPVNAPMSPWSYVLVPPGREGSPYLLASEVQPRRNHERAWPTSPVFNDATFRLDQTQNASQQVYSQPNSAPMSFVQPQLHSPAIQGSTEFGRGTARNPARLIFAPKRNNPQESFNLDVVERATKRARANTPESAKTLNHEQENISPHFDSPYEFINVAEDII